MPRNLFALILLLAGTFAAEAQAADAGSAPAPSQPCTRQTFEGAAYIVCSVDPAKADLRLFWKDAAGKPYRGFSNLAAAVTGQGHRLIFAMNAGMYREDFTPMGLYVEDGEALIPVNREAPPKVSGPVPNFFKQPNGIFYLDETGARIIPTADFLKQKPNTRLATQSGPMLVVEGKINPIFILGSTDRTRRNGVGLSSDGTLRFVISEDSVNFHDFARLFRDELRCENALFLDGGNGTGLYNPALGRNDTSWHGGYGPILGLVED
ncbi:uncharacterized protein YigE (DUF2233 family) [Rhizobium sp. BK529]|uniref:phosphodiester glycosidase family protein n=1 Tax=unclassified Rhizobium TaxID=2613769 RepID=UPI001044CFAB|nr:MULTISPECIES: phosphodiester glycosidase family protein [unclassified Rhizobium]MBB3590754.1 uncharacterized protein YigE (DUF2233 family) [Rhizobium sp. BK529]TCS09288.1 uncharacterized protein YigE (DUF2233 family) [Rhizobium sp. BK418]